MRPSEPIRPRLADLDEDIEAWPPAAQVRRVQPPKVGAAGERQSALAAPAADAPRAPIMGAIRERDHGVHEPPREAPRSGTSRFRAQRQMDRDAGIEPVSAFRRARMLRREQEAAEHEPPQPRGAPAEPAGRPCQDTPTSLDAPLPPAHPAVDPTRDPGGGAAPEDLDALLSIASENERRVAHMSYESMEEELRDAAAFFGTDTLVKLRERRVQARQGHAPAPHGTAARGWPAMERWDARVAPTRAPPARDEDDEAIRRYFRDEPEPAALAWTHDAPESASAAVRFDFQGRMSWRPGAAAGSDATYLAGLHHHGEAQQAPGYSLDELLHLARSAVAGQRSTAIQVLGRVCRTHPMKHGDAPAGTAAHALDSDAGAARGRILLTALWLLRDRHRSVQLAAVECLAAALQSVRAVDADRFALCELPVSADAAPDWVWRAQQTAADAWTPHAARPPFAAHEATPLEAIQHDWAGGLCTLGALDALAALVSTPRDDALCSSVLDATYWLAVHSGAAAEAFAQQPTLVDMAVFLGGTVRPWPLSKGRAPSDRALVLLLRGVQSGRAAAEALVARGAVDPLLRYVLLLPPESASCDEGAPCFYVTVTLRILAALARYGLDSAVIRDVWSAIPPLAAWAQNAVHTPNDDPRLYTVCALYELLELWTAAALANPSRGDLGANWPAVRTWAPLAVSLLQQAAAAPPSVLRAAALGAAASHLAAWVHAAALLDAPALHSVAWADLAEPLERMVSAAQTRSAQDESALVRCAAAAAAAQRLATLLDTHVPSVCFDRLRRRADAVLLDVLCSPMLEQLAAPAMHRPAACATILAHCLVGTTHEHNVRLLLALGPADGALAERLLSRTVSAWDANLWRILSPFLTDNLARVGAPAAPAYSMVAVLAGQEAPALHVPPLGAPTPVAKDPLTDAELWQSGAAGLPLRRDWPFVALDDLLHSSDARTLNRGVLPAAWDYNEADVVRASLQLAVHVARIGAQVLPSAWIHLNLAKVFLLEQGTGDRASGAATGRDLYADASIAGWIETLFDLADTAALQEQLPASTDKPAPRCRCAVAPTLEDAADAAQPGVSYYQLYTDLVGLYDAVSFGHPLFARALLPPLAMAYASDYRRLLWSDYAHVLRGIGCAVADAPAIGGQRVGAYLWPCETDTVVLSRYADALVSHAVQPGTLLGTMALHHVCAALWAPLEPQHWHGGAPSVPASVRNSLGRQLFRAPSHVSSAVLHYAPEGGRADMRAREAQQITWM